jgi:hypothetical protein
MSEAESRDRNNRLRVSVTPTERNIIQNNAAACAMSLSAYLRAVALGHEPKSKLDAQIGLELYKTRADLAQLRDLLRLCLTGEDRGAAAGVDLRALLEKIEEAAEAARDRVRAL